MVDAANAVRAAQNLEAAVLARGCIDRYEHTGQVGIEVSMLVPIAEVLVPFPGAADTGALERQLGMVETGRPAKHAFDAVHDPFAAGRGAEDVVSEREPQR